MNGCKSLINKLQKCFTLHLRKKSSFKSREPSSSPKFDFNLSQDVENDLLQNKYKINHHPGIMSVKFVKLPETIYKTVLSIKEEKSYHDKVLNNEAIDLRRYIYMREPPLEKYEAQQITEVVTSKLVKEGKLSPSVGRETILSIEDMTKEEKNKFIDSFQKHTYNWHPIDFDEFKSFVYLWARMAGDYAALIRIFSEIRKRRPNFKPRFLFDFGSGIGSVMWAAEHIWPNIIQEVYNVDASFEMNNLSERLFMSGIENNFFNLHKNSTYFRQYLPTSENIKYDLVVSSRSLFEADNINARIKTIDILWKKVAPGGFLVVVEAGTMFGYTIIMEIRDYLLEISRIEREKYDLDSPIHVFAPCPHDYSCPRFFHKSNSPCHFSVDYQPISSNKLNVDKFSYVVFQKEDRDKLNDPSWPRIVQPVLRRHHHVVTRSCTPSGAIRELVATKTKHGTSCYRVCRKCMYGDFLPVDIHDDSIKNSDKDIESNEALDSDENNESTEFSDTEIEKGNSANTEKVR